MDLEKLICPYCKTNQLIAENEKFYCKNASCNSEILSIKGKPVLIAFESSIVDRKSFTDFHGESVIQRNDKVLVKFLKNIFLGDSDITAKNFAPITDNLKKINDPKILVVGGGTIGAGLKSFYKEFGKNITSFDIYFSDKVDFIADAHNIPVKNEYFDFIVVQAVLEHVINPAKVVAECYRVLKPTGKIYAETPFMQQIHEAAYDFTRFTDSGHRYLFKNFELISSGPVAGVGTSLMWAIGYFFSGLFRNRKIGKLFRSLFFWLRFFDRIVPNNYNIDGASCVFFYGVKSNICLSDRDLIRYYQGEQ